MQIRPTPPPDLILIEQELRAWSELLRSDIKYSVLRRLNTKAICYVDNMPNSVSGCCSLGILLNDDYSRRFIRSRPNGVYTSVSSTTPLRHGELKALTSKQQNRKCLEGLPIESIEI